MPLQLAFVEYRADRLARVSSQRPMCLWAGLAPRRTLSSRTGGDEGVGPLVEWASAKCLNLGSSIDEA